MSRVKKASGKEYRRLAQSAESDDEVVLYSMSPSSGPSSLQPRAAVTEFGSGRYDKSTDLELPSPTRGERRRRRRVARGGKLSRGKIAEVRWRFSRETRACACFLVLVAAAVLVVLVVSSTLDDFSRTGATETSQPNASAATPSVLVPTPTLETTVPLPSSQPPTQHTITPPPSSQPPTQHTITPPSSSQPPTKHTITPPTEEPGNEAVAGGGEVSLRPTPLVESTPTANSGGGTAADTLVTPSPDSLPTPHLESPSPPPLESPLTPSPESPSTPPLESDSPPPITQQAGGGGGGGGEGGEGRTSILWKREFFPAITETSLQLQDMNGDRVSDVVMVKGVGACDMVIHALDGLSGETVWNTRLTYDPFALKCDVDLNKDDITDCVATGRNSGFRAISGADGSPLWDRDPRLTYFPYNFYYPLFVPDLDGDGVVDIINTHGGDSTYGDGERKRSPAFLVAVSGQTGQQLMERVPLPDGHESYMSPVYLARGEGDMIVVGTGGETLPGSLWAISFASLQTRVLNYVNDTRHGYRHYTPFTADLPCKTDVSQKELETQRPVFDPAEFDTSRDTDEHIFHCPSWGDHEPVWNKYVLCVYQLLSTEEKGVMLPPVVVDMTGDLQDDLVVSTFEGRTLVINGETGEVVWEVVQPGTESYSVPAPLFFNDDDIPDLVVRINYGVWSIHYNYSTITILDGQNGDTLWSLDSAKTEMTSSLSLAVDQSEGDAAVFLAVGIRNEGNPVIGEPHIVNERGYHPCLERGVKCWKGGVEEDKEEEEEEGRERRETGSLQIEGEAEEGEEGEEEGGEEGEEGGEEEEVVHGEDGDSEFSGHNADFMDKALAYRDPAGLWDGAGEEYPDPHTDLPAFLGYCGWREEELTASLYVISRQQILTGVTPSLISHGAHIYFPDTQKRHSGPQADTTVPSDPTVNLTQLSPEAIRELRCGHVQVPDKIVPTPAIGDVDHDGRLEIAYTVSWRGSEDRAMQSLPPRFTVYVISLEERMGEVLGSQWLQNLLPGDRQPWTRYMGRGGDNVYHRLP